MKLGGMGFYNKLILKGERSWRADPCSATELQACSVSGDWKLLPIKTSRGAYCSHKQIAVTKQRTDPCYFISATILPASPQPRHSTA